MQLFALFSALSSLAAVGNVVATDYNVAYGKVVSNQLIQAIGDSVAREFSCTEGSLVQVDRPYDDSLVNAQGEFYPIVRVFDSLSWELFDVSSNALGGWWPFSLQIGAVVVGIVATLKFAPRRAVSTLAEAGA